MKIQHSLNSPKHGNVKRQKSTSELGTLKLNFYLLLKNKNYGSRTTQLIFICLLVEYVKNLSISDL